MPSLVRQELFQEFAEMEAISEKLQHGEIHIAAFGRVGTGKSSLLNALLGRKIFLPAPCMARRGSSNAVSRVPCTPTMLC